MHNKNIYLKNYNFETYKPDSTDRVFDFYQLNGSPIPNIGCKCIINIEEIQNTQKKKKAWGNNKDQQVLKREGKTRETRNNPFEKRTNFDNFELKPERRRWKNRAILTGRESGRNKPVEEHREGKQCCTRSEGQWKQLGRHRNRGTKTGQCSTTTEAERAERTHREASSWVSKCVCRTNVTYERTRVSQNQMEKDRERERERGRESGCQWLFVFWMLLWLSARYIMFKIF